MTLIPLLSHRQTNMDYERKPQENSNLTQAY